MRIVICVLICFLSTGLFPAEVVRWCHLPLEVKEIIMKSMVEPIAQEAVDASEFYKTGFLVGERSQIASLYRFILVNKEHGYFRKCCNKIAAGFMKDNFKNSSRIMAKAFFDTSFYRLRATLRSHKQRNFDLYPWYDQSWLISSFFNQYFLIMGCSKIVNSYPKVIKIQLSQRYLNCVPVIDDPNLFFQEHSIRDDSYSTFLNFLIKGKKYRSVKRLISKGWPLFALDGKKPPLISDHVALLNEQEKDETPENKKRIHSILDDAYIARYNNKMKSYVRKKDGYGASSREDALIQIANRAMID